MGSTDFISTRASLIFGTVPAIIAVVLVCVFTLIAVAGLFWYLADRKRKIGLYIGVAALVMLFCSLCATLLVFVAGQGVLNTSIDPGMPVYQTCLSAPESEGCQACLDEGNSAGSLCDLCEKDYQDVSRTGRLDSVDSRCLDPLE